LEHLDAQKRALQARLGKQERAHDTRRKILLGALVLQRLATSHDADQVTWLRTWLRRELPNFLTRDGDKDLSTDLMEGAIAHSPAAAAPAASTAIATSEPVLEPA
jgi:hypothetical protein